MNILDKIKSIEYDKNRTAIFGIKSGIVWGNHKEGGTSPLLYISKPKNISQEDFELLLDRLIINVRANP
jgi:hypothetical protein